MAPADICRPGGTTSACAENTRGDHEDRPYQRNYLRVRGEYYAAPELVTEPPELPPRARRILCGTGPWTHSSGTTSACAENTFRQHTVIVLAWNYLRVRGEYLTGVNINMLSVELPPRARRIRLSPLPPDPRVGTTSACAENTKWFWDHRHCARNYLRVRGEYLGLGRLGYQSRELPPRARRILAWAGGQNQ